MYYAVRRRRRGAVARSKSGAHLRRNVCISVEILSLSHPKTLITTVEYFILGIGPGRLS